MFAQEIWYLLNEFGCCCVGTVSVVFRFHSFMVAIDHRHHTRPSTSTISGFHSGKMLPLGSFRKLGRRWNKLASSRACATYYRYVRVVVGIYAVYGSLSFIFEGRRRAVEAGSMAQMAWKPSSFATMICKKSFTCCCCSDNGATSDIFLPSSDFRRFLLLCFSLLASIHAGSPLFVFGSPIQASKGNRP